MKENLISQRVIVSSVFVEFTNPHFSAWWFFSPYDQGIPMNIVIIPLNVIKSHI